MNKRISEKVLRRWSAAALSLPMTLAHAKPSFFACDVGHQRNQLFERMTRGLGVAPDAARYAARHHWPDPRMLPLRVVSDLQSPTARRMTNGNRSATVLKR